MVQKRAPVRTDQLSEVHLWKSGLNWKFKLQRKPKDEEDGSMPKGPKFKSIEQDVLEKASFYCLIKGPLKSEIGDTLMQS